MSPTRAVIVAVLCLWAVGLAAAAPAPPARVGEDVGCALCEFALRELTNHLPANFTEAELKTDLDNLCARLPKTLAPECTAMIMIYANEIYAIVTGGVPPEKVCTSVRLCSTKPPPLVLHMAGTQPRPDTGLLGVAQP